MSGRTRGLLAVLCLAAPVLAQWSPPILVGLPNGAGSDFDPSPSADGLSLYFSSNRNTTFDLFVSTRAAPYGAFGAATTITELNSASTDAGPCVRGDELEIIFYSNRAGGTGGLDLWRATRPAVGMPWSTPVPVNELNSTGSDGGPSMTADGLTVFFNSTRTGAGDIYVATRPDVNSPFTLPVLVVELSTTAFDREPHVSADGLRIYWATGPAANSEIWTANRLDPIAPFGNVTQVAAVGSPSPDVAPAITTMGDELYFCSSRPGGLGTYDIYVSRFTGLTSNGFAGITSTMQLLFSDPASSGLSYYGAASFGSTPGIPVDTRVIPLNVDLLLLLSLGGFPPIFNGYVGVLDANGVSPGSIAPPNLPAIVGLQFVNAFVVLDPSAPSGIRTISNALEVKVL